MDVSNNTFVPAEVEFGERVFREQVNRACGWTLVLRDGDSIEELVTDSRSGHERGFCSFLLCAMCAAGEGVCRLNIRRSDGE
jgi:hypothetical protein